MEKIRVSLLFGSIIDDDDDDDIMMDAHIKVEIMS